MSRGKLDKITSKSVEEGLKSVESLQHKTLTFSPELISFGFPPKSRIPIASVCLQDATATLQEARYALMEAIAHIFWYREKSEPCDESLASFFGKFYLDDAALRIFAVKEHLTVAITHVIELSKNDLSKLRKQYKGVDDLTRIGEALKSKSPIHPLVTPILRLVNSNDWIKTKKYRNDWVHNKPWIVKGLGISYRRKNRLLEKSDWVGVTFGGGDEHDISVDELLDMVKKAYSCLVDSTIEVTDYFIDYLRKNQKTT